MGTAGTTTGNETRNTVFSLCLATVFLSLCDRVQMSIAIIAISEELGWSLADKAQVSFL
jgi:hypothetical protein